MRPLSFFLAVVLAATLTCDALRLPQGVNQVGRVTNAQRFKAGLPPLPPAKRTRTTHHHPRASPALTYATGSGSLIVTFLTDNYQVVPFEDLSYDYYTIGLPNYILQTNNRGPTGNFLNAVVQGNAEINSNSGAYAIIKLDGDPFYSGVSEPAQYPSQEGYFYETSIWSNSDPNSPTLQWINAGNSPSDSNFILADRSDPSHLIITGNLDLFYSSTGLTQYELVSLYMDIM